MQKLRDKSGRSSAFRTCPEARWREYVEQLSGGPVKYLLIAEAPPWSDAGTPQYVLDPASRPRTLMGALRNAFSVPERDDAMSALKEFAWRGLLVIGSIPFAMDYSGKRSRPKYYRLVQLTARSYLQEKLNSAPLSWSPSLQIAFSVHLNALAVMRGLGDKLVVGGSQMALSPEMIAVTGAHYPDGDKLRKRWGI
jgi:hypothetical protein